MRWPAAPAAGSSGRSIACRDCSTACIVGLRVRDAAGPAVKRARLSGMPLKTACSLLGAGSPAARLLPPACCCRAAAARGVGPPVFRHLGPAPLHKGGVGGWAAGGDGRAALAGHHLQGAAGGRLPGCAGWAGLGRGTRGSGVPLSAALGRQCIRMAHTGAREAIQEVPSLVPGRVPRPGAAPAGAAPPWRPPRPTSKLIRAMDRPDQARCRDHTSYTAGSAWGGDRQAHVHVFTWRGTRERANCSSAGLCVRAQRRPAVRASLSHCT